MVQEQWQTNVCDVSSLNEKSVNYIYKILHGKYRYPNHSPYMSLAASLRSAQLPDDFGDNAPTSKY